MEIGIENKTENTGIWKEHKIKLALGVLLIFSIIAIVIVATSAMKPSKNANTTITIKTTPANQKFLIFGQQNLSIYSFSGNLFGSANYSGVFADINTTSSPILINVTAKTMVPQNFSAALASSSGQGRSNLSSQKIAVIGIPRFSPAGLYGNFSIITYTGGRIGPGSSILLFADSDSAHWQIYTNGTYYYVTNATYFSYLFFYANNTEAGAFTIGSNPVAVPQGSTLFPQKFLIYLDSLKASSGLNFVEDGIWWYGGVFVYKVHQNQPSSGFALWK